MPQPAKLDRHTVLSELKSGVEIPGAQLSNATPFKCEDQVMAFTDTQARQLKAKLNAQNVRTVKRMGPLSTI